MAKATWLYRRGAVWYFRAKIRGSIVQRVIGPVKKELAAKVARDWYQKAVEEKLVLTLGETNRGVATIGELLDAYAAAGQRSGEVKPSTVRNNTSSLLLVVRRGAGKPAATADELRGLSTAVLTGDLVERYVDVTLREAGDSDRTRRTISSTLTQARSVVARKMQQAYRNLSLPDTLDGFRTYYAGRRGKKRYRLPPRELRDRTALEAARLAEKRPDLRMVYLLTYNLGLRAGEAAAVRWNWFGQEDDGRVFLHVVDRPEEGFEPKGYEGTVPVPAAVWAELRALSRSTPYVLPGASHTARYNLVQDDFSAWMRSIGWDAATYDKAAHELRKLIGSAWYKAFGAEGARERLRHALMQTTLDHYAHLDYTEMEALNENVA